LLSLIVAIQVQSVAIQPGHAQVFVDARPADTNPVPDDLPGVTVSCGRASETRTERPYELSTVLEIDADTIVLDGDVPCTEF
jgi:hypothetical protein